MARSINHNANTGALPDFRNPGILLRMLLIVNGVALLASLLQVDGFRALPARIAENAAVVEPLLILSLLVLAALNNVLRGLPYLAAAIAVIAIELALTAALHVLAQALYLADASMLARRLLIVALTTGILLVYFDLRGRALSPALAEARLQALQARIRPHFLFNSLNAVLSLVRQEPRRAEAALEDLAGLFRALMADNRELVPIASEVELCRQYLELEQLRLGERLQVEWHVDRMPADALVPPLALQPLLENAVYHGIEPAETPGVISINIYAARDRLHIVLRNPYRASGSHHAGNKMALANIRERLQLHFDVAAELATRVGENSYEVRITMPYRKAAA
ncbi:MAG: histidine kinase [Burkholderiales bacterium]|jgi:two-component system sensor histidine kinase AlgZ|nr:histidine kinase [Burkholderiales bacterium]